MTRKKLQKMFHLTRNLKFNSTKSLNENLGLSEMNFQLKDEVHDLNNKFKYNQSIIIEK